MIEWCRATIASYKKPRAIAFLDALPRLSSTGKIDKKALREPYWRGLQPAGLVIAAYSNTWLVYSERS